MLEKDFLVSLTNEEKQEIKLASSELQVDNIANKILKNYFERFVG